MLLEFSILMKNGLQLYLKEYLKFYTPKRNLHTFPHQLMQKLPSHYQNTLLRINLAIDLNFHMEGTIKLRTSLRRACHLIHAQIQRLLYLNGGAKYQYENPKQNKCLKAQYILQLLS